jgi:hypothetical protein
MRAHLILTLCLVALAPAGGANRDEPIPDTPFWQEYHEAVPLSSGESNDVRAIAVTLSGRVWIATGEGVRYREPGAQAGFAGSWKTPDETALMGPAYALCLDETWMRRVVRG